MSYSFDAKILEESFAQHFSQIISSPILINQACLERGGIKIGNKPVDLTAFYNAFDECDNLKDPLPSNHSIDARLFNELKQYEIKVDPLTDKQKIIITCVIASAVYILNDACQEIEKKCFDDLATGQSKNNEEELIAKFRNIKKQLIEIPKNFLSQLNENDLKKYYIRISLNEKKMSNQFKTEQLLLELKKEMNRSTPFYYSFFQASKNSKQDALHELYCMIKTNKNLPFIDILKKWKKQANLCVSWSGQKVLLSNKKIIKTERDFWHFNLFSKNTQTNQFIKHLQEHYKDLVITPEPAFRRFM